MKRILHSSGASYAMDFTPRPDGAYRNIPIKMLKQLLEYNAESGMLRWKLRSEKFFTDGTRPAGHVCALWNSKLAGKPALAHKGLQGYYIGTILGLPCKAHHAAWALHYGVWPKSIDHINGDKLDNRIINLRDAPQKENAKNNKISKANTSGVTGVWWSKNDSKWTAQIWHNNKSYYLGQFAAKQDAIAVRKAAEAEYGFHPNHGRL